MKKIAYIELDTHAEIARNLIDLLDAPARFSIDFFLADRILNQLRITSGTNIYRTSPETILSQLEQNQYDLVIIGTVHRNFHVLEAIQKKYKTAIIVHNLNFSKLTRSQLFGKIFLKETAYRLKLLLKEGLLLSPKIHANAKNLLVLDPAMASEKAMHLPVFYHSGNTEKPSDTLKIVVPGAVSQHRRDYRHIFNSLKNFQTPTKITFAGKAQGEELSQLQEFEKTKPAHLELQYFTEKISSAEFDQILKKADVLWCPVQKETIFFSTKEYYGITKMSGNLGDAIRSGKPAVFPKGTASELPFIFSEENDAEAQFISIKKHFSDDFSVAYSMEKISRKLEQILESLL